VPVLVLVQVPVLVPVQVPVVVLVLVMAMVPVLVRPPRLTKPRAGSHYSSRRR